MTDQDSIQEGLSAMAIRQVLTAMIALKADDVEQFKQLFEQILEGERADTVIGILAWWAIQNDDGNLDPERTRDLLIEMVKLVVAVRRGIELQGGKSMDEWLEERRLGAEFSS